MRKNVCLKSTLRRPIAAAFLLLLIGSISFMFIARAVEYIVVRRETQRVQGYYIASGSVGYLSQDVTDYADMVAQSPLVAYQDVRRYTSGFLGIHNADLGESSGYMGDSFPYQTEHATVLVYGTVTDVVRARQVGSDTYTGSINISIEIDTVLAGYPETVQAGKAVTLIYSNEDIEQGLADVGGLETGGRYLFKAYSSWPLINEKVRKNLHLFPLYTGGPCYLEAPAGTEIDLDGYPDLKAAYLLADMNQHLVKITTTRNMAAMPNIHEDAKMYHLYKGRWLNHEDEQAGSRVCVVEADLARSRGLGIGDTLSVRFCDLPATRFGYITPFEDWMAGPVDEQAWYDPRNAWFEDWRDGDDWDNWDAWQSAETTAYTEFEIVGIYTKKSPYRLHGTHDRALIFIPDSALPQGFGEPENGRIYGHQYSFVLGSALDQAAFTAETGAQLTQLDIPVRFLANNIENYMAIMAPIRQSTAFNAVVFAAVMVLALMLAVFIYLRQHRRAFAILRALGTPKANAAQQLLLPILALGAVGIAGGGLLAWDYALYRAARTLTFVKMPNGQWVTMGKLSLIWLAALCTVAFVLLAGFALGGAALVAGRPVLELVQGGAAAGKRKKPNPAQRLTDPPVSAPAVPPAPAASPSPIVFVLPPPPAGGKPSLGALARHVWRHMVRAPLKSALTVLVALCFVLALGWMSYAIQSGSQRVQLLYDTTRIEGRLRNSVGRSEDIRLNLRTSRNIYQSEYIEDMYLESEVDGYIAAALPRGGADRGRGAADIRLCGLTRPDPFYVEGVSAIDIRYAPGWDETLFDGAYSEGEAVPVLLSEVLMERLGLALGDTAYIIDSRYMSRPEYELVVAGQHVITVTDAAQARDVQPVLTPMTALDALEADFESRPVYLAARIIINRRYNSDVFKAQYELAKVLTRNSDTMAVFFDINEGELKNVVQPIEKNLRLLRVLYPVTIAVSALTAAGLALLLMLQGAGEAAVMRVLGAPRLRVRMLLCAQQLALCLLGLVLGLVLLTLFQGSLLAGGPLLCAAIYLISAAAGSVGSAIVISNKMPLELLQVKE